MTLVNRFSEGCGLFEFDIATPLFDQLAADFELLTPDPLQPSFLDAVDSRPGLYGLQHQGSLVYVGKADMSARDRLSKHRRQLEGRIGISPEEVSFRCLHFAHTWDPFKPESHMIRKYSPIWNLRGFGPNDPGRMRDKTRLNDDHWHVRYPIDPNHRCEGIPVGLYDPLELLRLVCKEAPYWVHFQGNRSGKSDEEQQIYEEAHRDFSFSKPVSVPASMMSVKDLVCLAIQALPQPNAWQVTLLPSHLLIYREVKEIYSRMLILWPPQSPDQPPK